MSSSISSQESEFERRLAALERDSFQCAAFAFTDFTHSHFENDFEVLDRLRQHPGFWNRVRGALQVSLFMTLSRLFDRTRGNDTIRSALDYGHDNHGIFSLDFLQTRKMRAGLSAVDAKRYAEGAPFVPRSVWRGLQAAAEEKQAIFDAHVAPIRHGVFAHAGRIDAEKRDALFTSLMLRTLEDLCVFPLRLSRAVGGFYRDGREPVLDSAPTILADVLKALPGPRVSTWDHLHAAQDAAEFFEWFRTTPFEE